KLPALVSTARASPTRSPQESRVERWWIPKPVFHRCSLWCVHSQNPQRPLFHLLGLSGRFVEPNLKVRPSLFPVNVDGGSHIVSHHDELRRPIIVMAAKSDNVGLSHSGR